MANSMILQQAPLRNNEIDSERVGQSLARPFLKWVGGKTQLIGELDANFPAILKTGQIDTYLEPFLGGGAVFFHVAQRYNVKRFVVADANPDLILAYKTIQYKVGQLITLLHDLQNKYLKLSESKREIFYYKVRNEFNAKKNLPDLKTFSDAWIQRTAQLIFLNKTCFNGLFRVNSAGLFNVAFGKYVSPKICDPDNLVAVSHILQRTEIIHCDFREVLEFVDRKTFVYLDPPYRPLTETANFTGYSASTFTAFDQQRLASFCKEGNKRGALLLLSNSDPANICADDSYYETTYPDFRIVRTEANRMVNCKADRRGKISELLLMNYDNVPKTGVEKRQRVAKGM